MVDVIQTLMTGQDQFEIIRDQIAALIELNQQNQQVLAAAEFLDPKLWELRVFTERSAPWEQFLNIDVNDANANFSPIVNVWFSRTQFPEDKGNTIEWQRSTPTFFIDIVGFASSEDDGGTGQLPGDREAAFTMQRGLRFVRRILMAQENRFLQLDRKLVANRWFQSIDPFQPQLDSVPAQQIVGARMAFTVDCIEFAPTGDESNILEEIRIDVLRAEDGQITLQQQFNYPLP